MAKIVGQLTDIVTKQFRNGGEAVYIVVNGTEYKFGKFAPRGFSKGDYVEFEAVSKPNGAYENWAADYKTLRKSDASAAGNSNPEPIPQRGAAPARGGYSPTGNDERQEIISKQAALNTGYNIFKTLVDLGAIVPPAAVKKNGLYDFYKVAFLEEAAKCYKLSTGKVWDINPADDTEVVDDFDEGTVEGDTAW
ncbi:hypothetical protein [Stenotrophomonas phage StenR_269]|nr:hypothetical protein [Stenotrophomonas phage StenR_269]